MCLLSIGLPQGVKDNSYKLVWLGEIANTLIA